MQSANPARYLQLVSIFETLLVTPLLECLYHKSLQSAEACYRYFQRLFQEQEQAGRLTVRESLLNATRDCLERLPPESGQGPWLLWLQYWKGRLKLSVRQDKRAEEILLRILPQTGDDIILKLWVLGDLGLAYYNQGDFRRARDYYQQVLDLAKETGQDQYNLPVWYYRVAQLHWVLEELEEAGEKYREAIKCAQGTTTQERNIGIEVSARIDLGGVLFTRGDWESALNETIEAFHLARTELTFDRGAYQWVIKQLMHLMARRDPRLLDTIFLEAEALFANTNDPLAALGFRRQYVSLMWQSGQLRRGYEELEELKQRAHKQQNELFHCELLLDLARLREEQGELESVVLLYDELAERAAREDSGAWYCAAAVSNRGMIRARLGLWEEAEADLREAVEKWRQMSHDKLESFIHYALATALRQQGQLQRAQESLDKAFGVLRCTHSTYLNDLYQEQGEIYQAQGRREEARREYQNAFERYLRLDQFKYAARSLGSLTTLASDRGDWTEAARCSAEANKLWQRLAEIDAYRPSDAQKLADGKNAAGVLAVVRVGEDRLHDIREARDLFRAAAEEVPENFWYKLNLAYACADLEEWEEAAQAVADVLRCSHKWLRPRLLYERLADFRIRQGEKMFRDGQYEAAARFYAESRAQLEGKVAFERLAEVDLRRANSLLKLAAADAGRLGDARKAFEEGLARAKAEVERLAGPETGDGDVPRAVLFQARFCARLGLLTALQDDLPEALKHFRASIELRAGAKQPDVVEDVVGAVSEFSDVVTAR
jgi:tetratricopeptide (TPR) repeat protein